jgi:transposase
LLVKIKRELENQVRGLLKNLGLNIGQARFNVFAVRAVELIEGHPALTAVVRPLLMARMAIEQQIDRRVREGALASSVDCRLVRGGDFSAILAAARSASFS